MQEGPQQRNWRWFWECQAPAPGWSPNDTPTSPHNGRKVGTLPWARPSPGLHCGGHTGSGTHPGISAAFPTVRSLRAHGSRPAGLRRLLEVSRPTLPVSPGQAVGNLHTDGGLSVASIAPPRSAAPGWVVDGGRRVHFFLLRSPQCGFLFSGVQLRAFV